MRTLKILILAAGLAGAARTARAEDVPGTQGFDHMTLGLWVGPLAEKGRLEPAMDGGTPVAFDQSGVATMARFQWGVYAKRTRFGTLVGVEGHLGFGWLTGGAVAHEGSLSGMQYGRFFHDFDALLNLGLLDGAGWRLAALGGFGYTTDRYNLVVGGKAQVALAGYALELWGHWRPGYGYGGRDSDEVRFGATVTSAALDWGAGVEIWDGELTSADGTSPRGRAIRGEYRAILGAITKRW